MGEFDISSLLSLFGNSSPSTGAGDSGITGLLSTGGSGLGSAMSSGDMGGALGNAPTGLFSGLLPGGGMTNTPSGALGGGISGDVNGAAPIGGATMTPPTGAQSALMPAGQQQQQQQQMLRPSGTGRAHTGNMTMQQIAAMYGLPAGLLASNV
ncbi:hypothetical protein P0D88_35005 [Paraburkholderia sp. RL18-103-BIB-C]|uniref:hypothetical protein n=1 Tax=Paraburkholderia sp. RL18-103-BIB-C TaxID=3031637 RepID=UPI0038B920B2